MKDSEESAREKRVGKKGYFVVLISEGQGLMSYFLRLKSNFNKSSMRSAASEIKKQRLGEIN